MKKPVITSIARFMPQKQAEFERLMGIEYPKLSLGKTKAGAYTDGQAEKLWSFWLQAYEAGKSHLRIERPDDGV